MASSEEKTRSFSEYTRGHKLLPCPPFTVLVYVLVNYTVGLGSQDHGSETLSVFRPLIKKKLGQGITLVVDRYAFSGVAFTSAKEVSAAWPQWDDARCGLRSLWCVRALPFAWSTCCVSVGGADVDRC